MPDEAKVHGALRGLGACSKASPHCIGDHGRHRRTIESQQADAQTVIKSKRRLIDYLQRFVGDLVAPSSMIAERIMQLEHDIEPLLKLAACRERCDSAPGEFAVKAF